MKTIAALTTLLTCCLSLGAYAQTAKTISSKPDAKPASIMPAKAKYVLLNDTDKPQDNAVCYANFMSVPDYNFGMELYQTRGIGIFPSPNMLPKVHHLRHVMTPSWSLSYHPDFGVIELPAHTTDEETGEPKPASSMPVNAHSAVLDGPGKP